MRRSVYVYGGLLVGLLVLAGLRWGGLLGSESDSEDGSVVLLKAAPGEIEKVTYHDEKQDVVLESRADDLGDWVWVTLAERKLPPKKPEEPSEAAASDPGGESTEATPEAKAEAGDPTAEAPPVEVKTLHFKGGEAAETLMGALAPFKALRRLDGLTPERLALLELDDPKAYLEVTRKGKVHRFDLGGEAYGTKDRYVRDRDGAVYLVDDESVRPLRFARSRLPERRLWAFAEKDIVSVRIEANDGRFVTMVQQNRDDRDKAYWAGVAAPDLEVSEYSNWLDKALRLKGLSNVEPGEEPSDLEVVFRMTLEKEKEKPVTVEILRAPGEGGVEEWYGRSAFTRSLLKLARTQAAEAAEDVPDVISAQPAEEEATEEEAAQPPGSVPPEPTTGAIPLQPPPVVPGMPPRFPSPAGPVGTP
ncbi:MAG: DUF4340 domain-containing protein [Deltaproteobacteria bacterium]|nr:DUF4340 domain-containing protein [Deltaproteobacteria bacterium]